jgi:hypothetical protein
VKSEIRRENSLMQYGRGYSLGVLRRALTPDGWFGLAQEDRP